MDPDATLAELRQLLGHDSSLSEIESRADEESILDAICRAEELFQSLDSWILKGGFLPSSWTQAKENAKENRGRKLREGDYPGGKGTEETTGGAHTGSSGSGHGSSPPSGSPGHVDGRKHAELARLIREFRSRGGRGIELAEEIDRLRDELRETDSVYGVDLD